MNINMSILFDQLRFQSFNDFDSVLSPDKLLSEEDSDSSSNVRKLLIQLYRLIGQTPPKNFIDDANILEAVKKNDIAFRFVELSLLSTDHDFGTIILVDKNNYRPSILHSRSGLASVFSISQKHDNAIEELSIKNHEVLNLFANSVEYGMQVYAQLPWNKSSLIQLFRFLTYGQQNSILGFVVATLLISFVQLLIPIFTSTIFGSIVPSSDYSYFYSLALVIAPLSLLLFGSIYFRAKILARLESVLDYRLQSSVIYRVLRQPLSFLQSYSVADFVLRIRGFTHIRKALTNSTVTTLFGLVFAFLNALLMYYYQSKLSVIVFALYFLLSYLFYSVSRKQVKLSKQSLIYMASVFDQTTLLVEALPQIRSTATETFFLRNWAKKIRQQADLSFTQQTLADKSEFLSKLSYQLTMTVILFLVTYDLYLVTTDHAHISFTGLFPYDPVFAGSFLAFIVAFTSFDSYYSQLIVAFADTFVQTGAQWQLSSELLDQEPEQGYQLNSTRIEPTGFIEFRGVYFSSSEKSILKNINLTILPGQNIGITGPSGSGKSTFIRLITALHLPDEGAVLVDNLPITKIDLRSLRTNVGVVTQIANIPSTSIKEFLAPSFSFSDDEIWEVLKIVCLSDEIKQMPMLLETILSEGATNISGGQRQRLLIAKALIAKPKILLLDEATSALPEETQKAIIDNISSLKITTVSIAHRLTTLKFCDVIYVLQNGTFVQSGNCEDLLKDTDGYFAKTWYS